MKASTVIEMTGLTIESLKENNVDGCFYGTTSLAIMQYTGFLSPCIKLHSLNCTDETIMDAEIFDGSIL